jgi:hypothetical protein
LPVGNINVSRFSSVAPSVFSPSALSECSNSAKAAAGSAPNRTATFRSRSSNPGKLVPACSPGGGTMPMREPGG